MTLPTLSGIKQGEAFQGYLDYATDGVPDTFSASELSAQVRDRAGRLLEDLTIADGAVDGRYTFVTATSTDDWPLGEVFMDVRRTSGSVVMFTQTVVIPVSKAITR